MNYFYRQGRISLTKDSRVATGSGTAWLGNAALGDMMVLDAGVVYGITSTELDDHLTLDVPATANVVNAPYLIVRFATAANVRDLMEKINEFLRDRQVSLAEFTDWMAGTPTGGPSKDGRYPLTDRFGTTIYARCPALLDAHAQAMQTSVDDIGKRMASLEANPSGYILPAASADTRGGIRIGKGLMLDDQDKVSVDSSQGGIGTTRNYTDTAVTGLVAKESITTLVQPTGPTSRVVIGERSEMQYDSGQNITSGGYLVAGQDVMSTQGGSTIDKLVGRMVQTNLTNKRVKAGLGIESVLSYVGATTTVESFAGFYWANLRGVPNIDRVTLLAAFANHDTESIIQSMGPFLNADMVELSPSAHPGLVPGRYYSSPYEFVGSDWIDPGVIYFVPIHLPHRATLKQLGLNVVNAGAGTVRIGVYAAINGQPTRLALDSGNIDVSTIGVKEATISKRLDSGFYFLCVTTSVRIAISHHSGLTPQKVANLGQTVAVPTSMEATAYIDGAPYGPYPEAGRAVKYSTKNSEPHLWYRV
ncbi:hypothetical protein HX794_23605 [Pseudomonas costantinii]|uniref:hypothetical protein n=1 Tax=Pseudomonas costantinii TaxID=168469 RepID=UPI00159FD338|nr:hypothetical protein [Pseudomonas costantinii]NVZ22635.1 hypothetical protein [Pseudomonas costantinii]